MIRARTTAALLVGAVLLAGCGSDTGSESGPGAESWSASKHPVATGGLIWASGSTVQLGDGSTIDTGSDMEGFVVAGDGVYFVEATDDGRSGELFLATADGVESTGAYADATSLTASADGRYLAFIDVTTGQKDSFDTPVANAVVVDVSEGKELVRSAEGMGDPEGDDDLADLYEDAEGPYVLGFTDDTAYVAAPDGAYAYDLATGDGKLVSDDMPDAREQDWYRELTAPGSATNPAGTWSFENRHGGRPPLLVPTEGEPVAGDAPYPLWILNSWLDDRTAIGSAAADAEAGSGIVLLACTVPRGTCAPVPGTEDGVQVPADRLGINPAFVRSPA